MTRTFSLSFLFTLILCLSSLPLAAEGAGGVEFTRSVGFPGASDASLELNAVGGFGYGVLRDGTVVGGFGMGSHIKDRNAGYGGMMQGWQHRWGPIVALATTKIGFGGVTGGGTSAFSLLGAAELQMGLLVLPWFEVGVKAGAMGTVSFPLDEATAVAWSPTVGVRLSWGSF